MSICGPCFNSGIYIDSCATGLTFSAVTPETNYLVCIQNDATNQMQTFEVISDQFGQITIEGIKIDPTLGYTLFLTLGATNSEKAIIIINEIEYDCISFSIINSDATPAVVSLT